MADGRQCRRWSRPDVQLDFPIRVELPNSEGRRGLITNFGVFNARKGAAKETVRNAGNGIAEGRAPWIIAGCIVSMLHGLMKTPN